MINHIQQLKFQIGKYHAMILVTFICAAVIGCYVVMLDILWQTTSTPSVVFLPDPTR